MSVRNLARAIIQGGRTDSSKWDRRRATRVERHEARRYVVIAARADDADTHRPRLDFELGTIVIEPEPSGRIALPPRRARVSPDFHDRLGPLTRWLDAQVGRSWEEAWHRLCLHDRSSVAGRHLVDDHARRAVVQWTDEHRGSGLVIDETGTLCREDDFESAPRTSPRPWLRKEDLDGWARGRRVVNVDGERHWNDGDTLVRFTDEENATFESLRGHDQRALRGYARPFGKKRLDRELPWKARWRANRAAIGRPIDD